MKEALTKVAMGTTEKFSPENMGIAIGILPLGGTEPEIPVRGNLPPSLATYVCENSIAISGLKLS